jgi:hypothetical protein
MTLRIPPHWNDRTSEQLGTRIAIMGVKQREADAQREREDEAAREAAAVWFDAYPDALLVEAFHEASRLYGDNRHQVFAFYLRVCSKRAQRDEYLDEAKS